MMKTKHSATDEGHPGAEGVPLLITAQGMLVYARCQRAWWLGEVLAYAPGDELLQAQVSLSRRQLLARRLALVGAGLIALAVLVLVLGLLIG